MSTGNRYFLFKKPVRWFKALGHADSNAYYGASRIIDPVYAQALIHPKDTVHALCGGTFLVRADGSVESGRFRLPKPPMEKTYGLAMRDSDILEKMTALGQCTEIKPPAGSFAYAASREAANRQFPAYTGCVVQDGAVTSPGLDQLMRAARTVKLGPRVRPLGGELRPVDVGLGPEPDALEACLQVRFEGYRRVDLELSPISAALRIRMQDLDAVMLDFAKADPSLPTIDMRSERIAFAPAKDLTALLRRLGDSLTACLTPA